jgi:hypothetical protein
MRKQRPGTPRSGTRRATTIAGALAAFTLVARLRGYKLAASTPVRCRRGHLFTTIWIPGVKLKALDLGIARIQYCPVGHHWSLVTPVRDSDLSASERAHAHATRDIPLP